MNIPLNFDSLCQVAAQTPGVPAGVPLRHDTPLADLGIDSLSLLNVMLSASKAFGISLKGVGEDSVIPATLGELFDFLSKLNEEVAHGSA